MKINERAKTADTEADRFESKVAEGLERVLAAAGLSGKFKVSRPDVDRKFYSDVAVGNGSDRVWVECKLNKYANFGGPSFKYRDGAWSCTTGDDGFMTGYMTELVQEHAKEFVSFCETRLRRFLEKAGRGLQIPTDLPLVIEEWKKVRAKDGDGDTLYICDPIKVEDLGQRVVSYYQNVKREPVYYAQVGDTLYQLDRRYNPLNLETQDGGELPLLAEAYPNGTFWFRAKGGYKASTGKYYYSIQCDVKVQGETAETESRCSLADERLFPRIKDMKKKNLIAEDGEDEQGDEGMEFPVYEYPRKMDGKADPSKCSGGIDKIQVGDDWIKLHFWYQNRTYTFKQDEFIQKAAAVIEHQYERILADFENLVTKLKSKRRRPGQPDSGVDWNNVKLVQLDHCTVQDVKDKIQEVWDDWFEKCLDQTSNMEQKLNVCSEMAAYRCQDGKLAKYAEVIRGAKNLSIYTRQEKEPRTDAMIWYLCIQPIGWFGEICKNEDRELGLSDPKTPIEPYEVRTTA